MDLEEEEKDRYEGGSSDVEGESGGRGDEEGEKKEEIDKGDSNDDDKGERCCAHVL